MGKSGGRLIRKVDLYASMYSISVVFESSHKALTLYQQYAVYEIPSGPWLPSFLLG